MANQYPHPQHLKGILAKIEATYSTDPTPATSADEVRIADHLWPNCRIEHVFRGERPNVASGMLSEAPPAVPTGGIVSMTIPVEVRGTGSAYAADNLPEMDVLLRSCGMTRTDNFGTDVSYTPSDQPNAAAGTSCTIYGYAGGKQVQAVGCRGTWRLNLTAGELAIMTFEMQGLLDQDPAETDLFSGTYAAQLPVPMVGASFTVGSWSPRVRTMELELGAQVTRCDSMNASTGVREFAISKYVPRFKIVAEAQNTSSYNPGTVLSGNTTAAIDATIGSAQYNRMDVDLDDAWMVNDYSPETVDDFDAWGLEYAVERDELTLKFD